jgi:hypothetical protein
MVQDLERQLRNVGSTLDGNWEENAKAFFNGFSSEAGNLNSNTALLDDRAREVEDKTVFETMEQVI